MKLVITGASGFIGGAFLRRLFQHESDRRGAAIEVVMLTSDVPGGGHLRAAYPDAGVFALNELSGSAIRNAMRGADVLLHLGWSAVPGTAATDPEGDLRTNLLGGLELLRTVHQAGVRRVIFLSSGGTVYGPALYLPIDETHPTRPNTPYGITKLTFERYLEWSAREHGHGHLILRPGNVYGNASGPNKPQGVVEHWLRSMLHDSPVDLWNGSEVVRDYVYIDDMVEVLFRALDHPDVDGTMNVGTGSGASLLELARMISDCTGRELKLVERPGQVAAIPVNVLDDRLLQDSFGRLSYMKLEEGLTRLWKAMQT